ncbi:MAG: hypothetical protein WC028_12055 [Candidatus Obscuribacterales bacterium]
MKNTPVTKAQIEQFLPALMRHYDEQQVLTESERVAFSNFFQAFLDRNIALLAGLFKVNAKAPEDCLLVMATFTQVIGNIVNNHSSYYSHSEGLLHLHARTKDPDRRPYSKATGEETHSLKLFLDDRGPTGYRHCLDDRLLSAGAGNGYSGSVEATVALNQLVRVVEEGIERLIADGRENQFASFDLSDSLVSSHLQTRQFVKDKRTFEAELAEAKATRNAVSYMYWRWENRAKLARFSL